MVSGKIFNRFITLILTSFAQKESLKLNQVDPLEKVLKEISYILYQLEIMLAVGGETMSIQLVVKANKQVLQLDASIDKICSGTEILTGLA